MQVVADHSIACLDTQNPYQLDNRFMRVFRLADYGVTGAYDVTEVAVGIEHAQSGTGADQPAAVKLWTVSGSLSVANLAPLATKPVQVPNMSASLLTVPVSARVPAGATLVVEFTMPNGLDFAHQLMIGSNSAGQSGPTYVVAPDCGLSEPTSLAAPEVGASDVHWVLSVSGRVAP